MNDKTNHIIFLVGPPGCGKSTFVKNNPFYDDAYIASTDDLIEEKGKNMGLTYNETYQHLDKEELRLEFMNGIREAIKGNLTIIVDRTNMTKMDRYKILSVVPDNYIKSALVFSFDDRVRLNSQLKERENKIGKIIPMEIVDEMINKFEAPTKEDFDSIVYIGELPIIK